MFGPVLEFTLVLMVTPVGSPNPRVPQEEFRHATPESQGVSAEALADLSREVSGYVDRGLMVGGELLVIKNRRTVLHEVFGHADLEDGVPWTKGTISNIRSMTKPITGAAVQILIDRGVLELDEPVAKFLAMWMDGGRAGDGAVLSEDAVERTLRPVSEMTLPLSTERHPTAFKGLEVYYGQMARLHVPVGSKGEAPPVVIGHAGADGTYALAWPETDLMVLLFVQQRGGSVGLRFEEALDRLLISPDACADSQEPPENVADYQGIYVADWANHMKEEFTVHVKNGRLRMDIPTIGDMELLPAEEAEGRWTLGAIPDVVVWFERDVNGEVNCLRVQSGALVHEAPRKGSPHETEVLDATRAGPEALAPYLGTYRHPDAETNARIFIDGDYLALEVGAGNVVHLWKHPQADLWVVREREGLTLRFQEEGGHVVAFVLDAAGVGTSPPFTRIR